VSTPATSRTLTICLLLNIVTLAALVVALSMLEITRDATLAAGDENLRELAPFWITSALAWCSLTATAFLLYRRQSAPDDGNAAGAARRIVLTILLIAAGARTTVMLTHRPALSDDMYRYIFDGENLAHGMNPYLPVPQDRLRPVTNERWPGEHRVAARINNPELTTIYLPTSQWTFGGIAMLTRDDAVSLVRAERFFRGWFIVADLCIIALLMTMLARRGRSLWWTVLYAWHPLPIAEVAGAGHQDVIGIALLLLALYIRNTPGARIATWTVPLALATLVKPVALPITIILLRGRPWRDWLISGSVGAVVCIAVAAPLWFTSGGAPFEALRDTSTRFSLKWAHFGSVYEPVLWGIERVTNTPEAYHADPANDDLMSNDEQERLARLICLGLILAVIATVFLSRLEPEAAARVILLSMVLFSSTAHPWYLLWALALAPLALSPAVWIASLTISWGYVQLGDVMDWTTPAWTMWAAYVPVYAALCIDLARTRRQPSTDIMTL